MPIPYEIVFAAFAFFLGACIGSFLNVCIYRMPRDLSVNEPRRSFCPSCKYQIPWWNNLPLISWLSLRGKCGNCGAKIAFRYFGVELLTALLFLAVWLRLGPDFFYVVVSQWVLLALLIAATFIDFEHFIIPDEITWGGAVAGIMVNLLLAPLAFSPGDLAQWFAAISGFALIGIGTVVGLAVGGPLKNMRSPGKFALSVLVSVVAALAVEALLRGNAAFNSTLQSVIGALAGYFLVWGIVEGGKLAFGKKRVVLEKPEHFIWTRHGEDADFVCGDEKQLWSDFFARLTDRLLMKCPEITVTGYQFKNVDVEFHYNRARIGDREWQLDQLDEIKGTVTEITIPREAMGFGDVKFMACIGAFLGWQGVLFTLVAASSIGAVIGLVAIAIGRREWSAKIPFGPYLSLGAVLWMFYGPQVVAWYWSYTHPEI